MFINYKSRYGSEIFIETIEEGTFREMLTLIKEYRLVDNNYYLSRRATKDYYKSKKELKK